jgi:sugar-phosphatase
MRKAVLFDMDGVLLQSEPIWISAKTHVLRKHHIPHSRLLSLQTIGLRLDEVVDYWFAHEQALKRERLEKEYLIHEITKSVEHFYERLARPSESLESALKKLKSNNFILGIASVSPMRLIQTFLTKNMLSEYFDHIISGELVQHSKPDPEIYLALAHDLGIQPSDCVAIEDSLNGLKSVQAAHMRPIFYSKYTHPIGEHLNIAHHTIDTFKNIPLHLFQ